MSFSFCGWIAPSSLFIFKFNKKKTENISQYNLCFEFYNFLFIFLVKYIFIFFIFKILNKHNIHVNMNTQYPYPNKNINLVIVFFISLTNCRFGRHALK
jgi:hypothetical protein